MKYLKKLWVQVLIGMIVGILLGLYYPDLGTDMKPWGDAFIFLIKMVIPPVIFCTVVHGIAGMNNMRQIGRISLKTLVYFEIITTVALLFGLVMINLWPSGQGMDIDPNTLDSKSIESYLAVAHDNSLSGFLMQIIPKTFSTAFVSGNLLQVLFISVLFGIALAAVGEKGRIVTDCINSVQAIFFKIIHYIMYFSPIGAFGGIAFTVGKFGPSTLFSLGELIIEFFIICGLFVIIVFGFIGIICKFNIFKLIKYLKEEVLIVAATTSTETVLPNVMEKAKNLGCDEKIVGFVVPAGYSFNLDGTCLYMTVVPIFLAQATNTQLGLWDQLLLVLILLLTSKGAAGVAGAAFVILAATLSTLNQIPITSIALILGIHRILAEGLTFVNLIGNTVSSIVISKWEKCLDHEKLSVIR